MNSNLEHKNVICIMCTQDITTSEIREHIPCCYRKFCINILNTSPLCTCDECKGLKIHSIDELSARKRLRGKKIFFNLINF